MLKLPWYYGTLDMFRVFVIFGIGMGGLGQTFGLLGYY
jgi:hypothetical protein